MPRGKVEDESGQPRREGYSCLDSLSDGGRSNGESSSFSKVVLPGGEGDGVPLSCGSAVSSGPGVDGGDATVDSFGGVREGARAGSIQAVPNSNLLSVLVVHLDTGREGFVEEFDGVEGLFLGHIRTGGSTGDLAPDVRALGRLGWGKAVLGG